MKKYEITKEEAKKMGITDFSLKHRKYLSDFGSLGRDYWDDINSNDLGEEPLLDIFKKDKE